MPVFRSRYCVLSNRSIWLDNGKDSPLCRSQSVRRGLVMHDIMWRYNRAKWQPVGESNPSFQVENLAS